MPSVIGVWRLVAIRSWNETGQPLEVAEGDDVVGVAMFTAGGRMSATVARPTAQAARPFVAYHGSYAVDGTTLTTMVDESINAAWIGGEQVREARFEGEDRLFLRPPQRNFGGQRVQQELEWVRVG